MDRCCTWGSVAHLDVTAHAHEQAGCSAGSAHLRHQQLLGVISAACQLESVLMQPSVQGRHRASAASTRTHLQDKGTRQGLQPDID